MDNALLKKHIQQFIDKKHTTQDGLSDYKERLERITYYQSWIKDHILKMSEDDLYEYMSRLWAMLIWGNKHYVVDKIIRDNGFENIKHRIADIIWGSDPIEKRWDTFHKQVKGIGPAMVSELLCHVHPDKYILWNRRAYVGLRYVGVKDLPRYNYQLTGKVYVK